MDKLIHTINRKKKINIVFKRKCIKIILKKIQKHKTLTEKKHKKISVNEIKETKF